MRKERIGDRENWVNKELRTGKTGKEKTWVRENWG
jgi:hypothetical protein